MSSGRAKSLPLTLTLTNSLKASSAVCIPWHLRVHCTFCLKRLKKDLRQFMKATRRHSITWVTVISRAMSMAVFSPPAISRYKTNNSTIARARHETLSVPTFSCDQQPSDGQVIALSTPTQQRGKRVSKRLSRSDRRSPEDSHKHC